MYIAFLNNNKNYYIIFNLFKNFSIKILIFLFIFLSTNNYYLSNNKIYLNTSILLSISYILTNEYLNNINIINIFKSKHISNLKI